MKCANYAGQKCDELCDGNGCRVLWRRHTVEDEILLRKLYRRTEDDANWWMYA